MVSHEGGAFLNGISHLQRRDLRDPRLFPPGEVIGAGAMAVYEEAALTRGAPPFRISSLQSHEMYLF